MTSLERWNNEEKKIILLIGATQNGKSTFGNFLVHGKPFNELDESEKSFKVGDGLFSCTSEMQFAETKYTVRARIIEKEKCSPREEKRKKEKGTHDRVLEEEVEGEEDENDEMEELHQKEKDFCVHVVDTPGVGHVCEAGQDDDKMMISMFEYLQGMKKRREILAGVVLIVRYPQLLSSQFKSNVNFYKRMLGEIFEQNVVLVLSHVRHYEDWIEDQGGPETLQNKMQAMRDHVENFLDLDSRLFPGQTRLPVFGIDSRCRRGRPGWKNCLHVRNTILERACVVDGISLGQLKLPKTQTMLSFHRIQIGKLKGERYGVEKTLPQIKEAKELDKELVLLRKVMKKEFDEYCKYNRFYGDLLFEIGSSDLSDSWQFISKEESKFDIKTEVDIHSLECIGGKIEKYEIDEKRHKKGIVKHNLSKNMNASIRVYVMKKNKHRKKLKKLWESRMVNVEKLKTFQGQYEEMLEKEDNSEEMRKLVKRLKVIDDSIEYLSRDSCSVEEFRNIINEMKKEGKDEKTKLQDEVTEKLPQEDEFSNIIVHYPTGGGNKFEDIFEPYMLYSKEGEKHYVEFFKKLFDGKGIDFPSEKVKKIFEERNKLFQWNEKDCSNCQLVLFVSCEGLSVSWDFARYPPFSKISELFLEKINDLNVLFEDLKKNHFNGNLKKDEVVIVHCGNQTRSARLSEMLLFKFYCFVSGFKNHCVVPGRYDVQWGHSEFTNFFCSGKDEFYPISVKLPCHRYLILLSSVRGRGRDEFGKGQLEKMKKEMKEVLKNDKEAKFVFVFYGHWGEDIIDFEEFENVVSTFEKGNLECSVVGSSFAEGVLTQEKYPTRRFVSGFHWKEKATVWSLILKSSDPSKWLFSQRIEPWK